MDKYLRVYAKVDLDAIYQNILNVRKKIGNEVKLLGVIKADAYGHGAVEVGLHLQEIVDGFAIAVVEEGIILRDNGIQKPLLILGFTAPYQYPELLKNDISQTIYDYDMAKELNHVAAAMHTVAKVHIKLDTGMTRIGIKDNEEGIALVKKIAELPCIQIEGLFTHFAKADMTGTEYTDMQFLRFMNFAKRLEEENISIPIKHVANSAAIMDYENTYLDQVRSGIITYGLYPSEEVNKEHLALTPAMELKSHIVYVKDIEPGTSIGYGGTFVAEKPMKIATIPVGYGDGYPRSLSNKGSVLIHGKRAPIVGRICMDQFMVDVTDIEGVAMLDEVTLVGRDGDTVLPVEEVADLAGSFNYEFCCDVGRRIPRVYYKDGKYYKTADYFNC